jgi:alpha-mannosidase
MTIEEILVLHHTHTDVGYTHPQPMFWELSRRYIDQAIDLADRTADWPADSQARWTCEVTAPVVHWLRHAPTRQIDRFRAAAGRGQISVAALPYNLTPLCSADELARCLHPLNELRQRLDVPATVAINHDVNGLPWPIADLLLDAGVRGLVMGINIAFGGYPLRRPLPFLWKTPAGRAIPVMSGEHYGAFDRETQAERGSIEAMGDNNPPFPQMFDLIRQWNHQGRSPRIVTVTAETLLARLEALAPGELAEHAGDWTDYWNFGCASTALEVSLSRRAKARWRSAQLLRAARPLHAQPGHRPHTGHWPPRAEANARSDQAFDQFLLFDEHTWGCANSIHARVPSVVAEQWHYKANTAAAARTLTGILLRDELERLAGNPLFGRGVRGVLLVNPTPMPRQEVVRLPRAWVSNEYQHLSGTCLGIEYGRELLNDDNSFAAAIDLPPFGYRVAPLSELAGRQVHTPAGCACGRDFLESPMLRLTFDPETGRITRLFDKTLAWQVVDAACQWPFLGYVHEAMDPALVAQTVAAGQRARDQFFDNRYADLDADVTNWFTDWPAVRRGPSKLLNCKVGMCPRGPKLELVWEAPGCVELRQTMVLHPHRPTVSLDVLIQTREHRQPQSIYFVLPLNLPGWTAHFDTADIPVEFDRDQLPGVSRDWVTVGQYITLHNGRHAATLACPDAPMVQIGGFHFGRNRAGNVDRDRCLLLAWPMNNYWSTNFRASQPGDCQLSYELTTHKRFDPAGSAYLGIAAAQPIEVHPILTDLHNGDGRLADVRGQGIVTLSIGPSRDDRDVVVRCLNVTSQPDQATIALPGRTITAAWLCDTLENPVAPLPVRDAAVSCDVAPRAIRTLRIRPAG